MQARVAAIRPRLYRVAYAWCHDPHLADDIVQETLAKALRNARQLKDIDAFDGWMFSILNNCWRDVFRRRHPTVDLEELSDLPSPNASPEEDCVANDTIAKVRKAIAELPMGQRQVVTLIDLEQFTYGEAAQALAIPIGTVMSRLCRAREALRTRLQTPLLRVVNNDMSGKKNE